MDNLETLPTLESIADKGVLASRKSSRCIDGLVNLYYCVNCKNVPFLLKIDYYSFSGNYPLHFHMCHGTAGYAKPPYLRKNSVHHSFARCITIHGTHDITVCILMLEREREREREQC